MDTARRVEIYGQQPRITNRMSRRLVKKANKDPFALVERNMGMGVPAALQGQRVLTGYERPCPATL